MNLLSLIFGAVCFVAVGALEPKVHCNSKNTSIIIVGAGISGLGAADYLINEYKFQNVIVLEALDRVGGRIYTLPFDHGSIAVGAQWVHGRNNSMFELVKNLSALASQSKSERYDNGEQSIFYTKNGCKTSENKNDKLLKLIEMLDDYTDEMANEKYASGSVGQLYQTVFDKYVNKRTVLKDISENEAKALFDFVKKKFETENSVGDWSRASLRQMYEYTPTIGGSDIPLGPNGYQPVLDYFIKRIPKEKLRLKKTVTKIVYRPETESIIVKTSDNEVFSADYVIVTSSLGYLKKHAPEMFDPPLPAKTLNTIMALGFDTVDKVFLVYDEPFWDSDKIESLNFLRNSNEATICNAGFAPQTETSLSRMFFNFEPQPFFENVLLAFVGGDEHTSLMERSSDTDIGNAATELFRRFLNDPKIPTPKRVIRSSWHLQPTILGSYSYYSTDCDRIKCDRKSLQMPVFLSRQNVQVPAILFAGEATSEHQFQTTHGGLTSGRRQATRINDFVQGLRSV